MAGLIHGLDQYMAGLIHGLDQYMAWINTWPDLTWPDLTWLSLTWPDLTWLSLTWLSLTWLVLTWLVLTRGWSWLVLTRGRSWLDPGTHTWPDPGTHFSTVLPILRYILVPTLHMVPHPTIPYLYVVPPAMLVRHRRTVVHHITCTWRRCAKCRYQ